MVIPLGYLEALSIALRIAISLEMFSQGSSSSSDGKQW